MRGSPAPGRGGGPVAMGPPEKRGRAYWTSTQMGELQAWYWSFWVTRR